MTDLASLSFAIDSAQAVTSLDALTRLQERAATLADQQRKLSQESGQTDTAFGRLRTTTTAYTASMADLGNTLQQVNPQIQRTSTIFEDLASRLAAAQKEIAGLPDGVDRYLRLNREAEAMARNFGQGTEGLVAFINRTNDMRLSAETTAASLDRITRALENQTAAGAAARAVLKEYGVEVEKYGLGQADKVFGDFVSRARGYRDSPAKVRDLQAVLGPLSSDDLNTVLNPGYTPLEQRQRQQEMADASAYTTRTFDWIGRERRERENDLAAYNDLRARFDVPQGATMSDTLRELRRIEQLSPEEQRPYLTRAAGEMADWKASPVGSWWNYAQSGRYSVNEAAIDEQWQRTYQENSQPSRVLPWWLGGGIIGDLRGRFVASWERLGSDFANMRGTYEAPQYQDQRPEDPYAQVRRDLTLATQLASYGEVGFMGTAGARQRLLRMDRESGLDAFRHAYGAGPDTDQRYENIRRLNEDLARYGQTPEARLSDATGRASFLSGQAPGGRAFAAYVMQQASALNVPTSRMGNYQDGADFLARGGFTQGMQLAVQQGWEQQGDQRMAERNQALQDQIELQNQLREASARGTGAVEEARVAWLAYNAEIKAGGTAAQAWSAAETAKQDLLQKNLTLVQRNIDQMRDDTAALKARNDAAQDATSAQGRLTAQIEADIAARARGADQQFPGTGAGERTADQERARLSQQARQAGDQILAQTQEQLRLETQISSAAGQRGEMMEKLRRDQQIDQQFQEAMAQAIASRDQERIRALERQVQLVKDMRDQIAEIQRITQIVQQLQVIGDQGRAAAQQDAYLMDLPPDQRGRAAARLSALQLQERGLFENATADARQRYAALPERLRAGVDEAVEPLTAAQREAFRATIGYEVGGQGERAFANPAQVTSPAIAEVMRSQLGRMPTADEVAAERARLQRPENFQESLRYGVHYYRRMLGEFDGDISLASVAYRTGPGPVRRFRETGDINDLRPADQEQGDDPALRLGLGGYRPTGVDGARGRRRTIEGDDAIAGADAGYDARVAADRQRFEESIADRRARQSPYLRLMRAGETGLAQRLQAGIITNPEDPLAGRRAQEAMEQVSFGQQAEFQSRLGGIERETAFQQELAAAYGESAAKVQEVTVAYRAMQQAKQLGLSATETEILKEKELKLAREQTLAQAAAATKSARDQGDLYKADAETPWWAGPQSRARARAQAQADLYIRDNKLEGRDADNYREAVEYRETQRAIAEDQDKIRQGFLSMGQSAQSAFAEAVIGGRNLQQVLSGLLRDWASIMLNVASRRAFTWLGDQVMGLFNPSGAAGAAAAPYAGVNLVLPAAAGAAFENGQPVQMLAAGDVVDRPSTFTLASGRKVLTAEAGRPEGVFPLTRTERGELGVQVAPDPSNPGQRREALPLTRMPNGDLAVKLDPAAPMRHQEANQLLAAVGSGRFGIPIRSSVPAMMAAGGVVDGGMVRDVAQVAPSRSTAALPLPVAAMGPAGVQGAAMAASGGAARAIQVTNNISIQGSATGKNGMDQEAQRALERQIEAAVRQAVQRGIAEEKRPGGMLF